MKASYKVGSRLTIEVEVPDVKKLFSEIAEVSEIFSAVDICGKCGGTSIQLVVREVGGNKYHEARCTTQGCRAKLEFGQLRDGSGIFPKKKDKDGNWLPNNGWTVYQKAAASGYEEEAPF